MRRLDPARFSRAYAVRRLGPEDREEILELYRTNLFFFQFGNAVPSAEYVDRDMTVLPPGLHPERKYYAGYYDGGTLAAVLDLVDGYPLYDIAYIGLFMVSGNLSGQGRGSSIITELSHSLKKYGFLKIRLAYSTDNPQSSHFWRKNGFQPIYQSSQPDYGQVTVAERTL